MLAIALAANRAILARPRLPGLFGVPVSPVVLAGLRPAPKGGGVLAWRSCRHASTPPVLERPARGSRATRAEYAVQEHQKALP